MKATPAPIAVQREWNGQPVTPAELKKKSDEVLGRIYDRLHPMRDEELAGAARYLLQQADRVLGAAMLWSLARVGETPNASALEDTERALSFALNPMLQGAADQLREILYPVGSTGSTAPEGATEKK